MVGYMSNIVQSFVDRITESWRESVQKILQTSEILVESEKTLSDIDFLNMVGQLPMSQSTISKLLMIGKNTYLPQKVKYLPPHWTTIYEISTLDNKTIDRGVDEGFINPSSTKKEIDRFRTTIEEVGEIIEREVVSITTDEPTFGKITVSTDFDLDKIDDLRKDLTKLEKKYGIVFSSDKSKSGLLGLRRKLLSKQIDKWLEERKSEYNEREREREGERRAKKATALSLSASAFLTTFFSFASPPGFVLSSFPSTPKESAFFLLAQS